MKTEELDKKVKEIFDGIPKQYDRRGIPKNLERLMKRTKILVIKFFPKGTFTEKQIRSSINQLRDELQGIDRG